MQNYCYENHYIIDCLSFVCIHGLVELSYVFVRLGAIV